jgi:hypothetical protein
MNRGAYIVTFTAHCEDLPDADELDRLQDLIALWLFADPVAMSVERIHDEPLSEAA